MNQPTTQSNTYSRREYFFLSDVTVFQNESFNPIDACKELPILPLEKAVEELSSIVPGIEGYVNEANLNCNLAQNILTPNESAAIYLYTMATSVFGLLNKNLRAQDRDALKPWLPFFKLLMSALEKLPSLTVTIWRGVGRDDVIDPFYMNGEDIWCSINSCSKNLEVIKQYIEKGGTVFNINTKDGKDISSYSKFGLENEIVLLPGSRLVSENAPSTIGENIKIFQLKHEHVTWYNSVL